MKFEKLSTWFTQRYPWNPFFKKHLSEYYAPKNFNFWYYFGSFSLFVLVTQIITGIWLTMEYTPTNDAAFASVQHIMRDVRWGWLIRYFHTTGASAFFIVVYLHMYRALMYGSYKKPRELLWLIGMLIYVVLLAEAFTGYVLPWGQMSFWGAQVITSFASAIPFIGKYLVIWIRGDFNVSGVTLHRFFSLHVIAFPLVIVGLVFFHLVALHYVGSNNPEGIDYKKEEKIPFYPYYVIKDLMGLMVFLFIFAFVLFYAPAMNGLFLEADNFVPANPLLTPEHIAPVWYMTPYYAILRAVPNKFLGLTAMAAAIAFLFVLPWLDRSRARSFHHKGWLSQIALVIFVICFVGLGYLGIQPVSPLRTFLAALFAIGYFLFFITMPFYTAWEKTR